MSKVTPMCPKKAEGPGYQGLSYIVVGLPYEDKLKVRMILLGAEEPEDFQRVLLKDSEFCEILAQSLYQAIQTFVSRKFRLVPHEEIKKDIAHEVFLFVWSTTQDYDPRRVIPLLQYWWPLFLRAFSAYNRQQSIWSREIPMSVLREPDGDDDHDDSPEDSWDVIADGRNLEEEVLRRDELEKFAFFEDYLNSEELAEAIENASKVKRHRWRRRLLDLRDQLMLRRTKPKRRKTAKNHCDRCKKGFRMQSAFKAFGARYLVAKCPACNCRVVFPAKDRGSRYQMKKQQVVSTFVGGDKNA